MSGERLLVVDDEEDILELLRYNLEREGYSVVTALSGEEAVDRARSDAPDLILLDLMLPGMNGLDVCRILSRDERTQSIPIIILTARAEEADIVAGLELGADDYISKPFSPRVVLARVKTVLRRGRRTSSDDSRVIQAGGIRIDVERHQVRVDTVDADLTATEFDVLLFLARHRGWVFTRDQIIDAVKGTDYPVTDRSVDVQIVGLRRKLGPAATMIETVRGVGYRMKDDSNGQD
ncbi:MAG TPA: response regulator transcription factor [Myxococcota bacterium]|nr:response regulator transcription factor [Myxococcota bacterium]HOD07795.1 response regulator transcription factor [Myxococcota bacterium]HPB50902.1 response regulator transcription factor [Myxococcota bacterium]HQP95117.1 response regulator transcription factor [Myxococcota bacterium]